jgi:CheY-like chemotaxis protein
MATDPIVLVADDDDVIRELVAITLAGDPFTLLQATGGDEALALARRTPPALALLDLMMPGADGAEVCRALKADPTTAATRVVILTAQAMEHQRQRGLAAGADAYLTKPFSPTALRDLVLRLLRP